MGPTGSDVGRGTAAGYVNMQTKTPHLPRAGSATLTVGTANQRRATLDVNQPLSVRQSRQLDRQVGRPIERAVAGQRRRRPGRSGERDQGVRAVDRPGPRHRHPGPRLRADPSSAQSSRLRHSRRRLAGSRRWRRPRSSPANPVDQSNYYGSPAFDYDHADQNTVTARLEHNLSSRWAVTNQTRYNKTEREAVISTVQSVASFVPATELVTVARQGNARENTITSNQTTLSGRFMTGRLEHNISSGLEFVREAQFAPTLTGVGTRAPVSIYDPNPNDPVTGYAVARTGAFTDGQTDTAAIYAFDSLSLGTRVQVNGGLRFEHYDTEFRSVDAANVTTVNASGSDGLLSGKAGVVVRARPNGNVYVSYGTTVTPPGAANFTLSTAPNNQNNPNVKAAGVGQLRGRHQVGRGRRPSLVERRRVPHHQQERALHGRCGGRAADLQPGRQAARRRRHVRRDRTDHATVAGPGERRLPRHRVVDPERREQRQAAHALAGALGQPLDDLSPAEGVDARRRRARNRRGVHQRSRTPSRRPAITSSTDWWSMRSISISRSA